MPPKARRARGNIYWLPSGGARVTVYGGIDQLTGKRIQLRETVVAQATKRQTEKEAEKVQTRLLNQVDERRSPKTEATINYLLDKWLEVIDVERAPSCAPRRARRPANRSPSTTWSSRRRSR